MTIVRSLLSVALVSLATSAVAQERIVAIGGSLTEIVYALGQEERLIARDSTSLFPAQALDLPDVGYMRALSPEGVLSVDPDLILTLEGAGPPEAVAVIKSASVPVVTVPESFDREGVLAKIDAVGQALGIEEEAAELAADVDADLRAAEDAAASIDERARVLFILSMEGGRVLASGTGTAANGMIELAGGQNAITDYAGYKQLTDEAIVTASPDVILLMNRGGESEPTSTDLSSQQALSVTPAAQNGRVVLVEGNYVLGFGPRTGAAARELADELYGNTVTD
ncbi:ABC transporter substrate-binding protein [Aliihoeflea aestuarii]|jgi:iron complex transport system substrate-binding protein|uniref:heme/hemin ABC transporter substrate-binding protein n=1 Tax=Aliihoeflea aestuarii TaxID=453840 RepID=UPI0020936AAB|nr:ABC transporter substrate-binding protein [Aliihoeflea aestuarii]MCO6390481.1 ABC transporter substrate-binding protein [Aliihoeflea aestuarii]